MPEYQTITEKSLACTCSLIQYCGFRKENEEYLKEIEKGIIEMKDKEATLKEELAALKLKTVPQEKNNLAPQEDAHMSSE